MDRICGPIYLLRGIDTRYNFWLQPMCISLPWKLSLSHFLYTNFWSTCPSHWTWIKSKPSLQQRPFSLIDKLLYLGQDILLLLVSMINLWFIFRNKYLRFYISPCYKWIHSKILVSLLDFLLYMVNNYIKKNYINRILFTKRIIPTKRIISLPIKPFKKIINKWKMTTSQTYT